MYFEVLFWYLCTEVHIELTRLTPPTVSCTSQEVKENSQNNSDNAQQSNGLLMCSSNIYTSNIESLLCLDVILDDVR